LGKLAAAGFLEAGMAGEIKEACLLYHRITQVLRLCVNGAFDPAKSPAGLNQLVARAAGVPDIRAADSLVNDTQKRVAGLFDELIGRADSDGSGFPFRLGFGSMNSEFQRR
jgi:glutamate-ammonia-ligase adenylyltransferase